MNNFKPLTISMSPYKYITLTFFYFFFLSHCFSQNLAIGTWRAHLPFNKARFVTEGNNSIICGAEDGLFIYNKSDNSMETFSKVNGLSDINLSILRYNAEKDILFVGYENGNIDLIHGKDVYNIPDIKRKNIIGSKRINNLVFFQQYAYAACNFGMVVINLDKKEIKDSYYLTLSGSKNSIYGITTDGNNIYAATDSGVFQNNIFNANINYFPSWNNLLDPSAGTIYNQLFWFNNKLYVSKSSGGNNDVFVYNNNTWSYAGISVYDLRSVQAVHDKLVVAGSYDVRVYDSALQELKHINNPTLLYAIRDAITDQSGNLWICDNNKGLMKASNSSALEYYVPDGPRSNQASIMQNVNGQLWVGHAAPHGNRWDPLYSNDGFSTFKDNKWNTYDKTNTFSSLVSLDTVKDFMSLAVDPRNSDHVFLGSRGKGIIEFENGSIKNYFSEFNSAIQTIPGFPGTYWIGGIAFDSDNNLWVVNSNVPAPLLEYKTDGTWQAYSFPGFQTNGVLLGDLMYSSYGHLWINVLQKGILTVPVSDINSYTNSANDTSGLPSADVRAFVEDKEGQVWIGTTKGVAVVYAPGSSPQQILLQQDGTYQYLLETEAVTSIAIDGANRKWFGTANAGVFLMSADGTKQLEHFTAENSPLLSNYVFCLAMDQKTGELFIGTERGIISYKGDATEGKDKCENTYVYPNPVKHEYQGPIAITGIVNDGNVKITDISGTLVYETKALGGQAIWYGKNFKGEKARTGVYLVFCSDQDGKNTCITKLLFMN